MQSVLLRDLAVIDYGKAWHHQQELFDGLIAAKRTKDKADHYLLLCEHPHVYTLGKSGAESNLLVDEKFLRSVGATYFKTDRGGDITYHGYGQLVGYPILDLERFGLGLKEYIHALEECVIRTVADYGIPAERLEGATGVWVETGTPRARKICAIGVRASRFVTMHGFALNVDTDLTYFTYIHPCGFTDKGVTSLERETGTEVEMGEVKSRFAAHFEKILKCKINKEDYACREKMGSEGTG